MLSFPKERRCAVAVLLVVMSCAPCAQGAEPSEAENLTTRLEESEQPGHKGLAKIWKGLVRQRQWADATGKHKTYASYLEHDPKLQWVRLRVAIKGAEEITYKDAQIPLSKLDPSGQALVKRIAVVRARIEKELGPSADGPEASGTEPAEASPAEATYGGSTYGEAATPAADMTDDSVGDPYSSEGSTPRQEKRLPDANQPLLPDEAAWRSDFEAFRQSLRAEKGPDGTWIPHWGDVQPLEAAYQAGQRARQAIDGGRGRDGTLEIRRSSEEALDQAGDVVWEATLLERPAGPGTVVQLDLPALNAPFQLELHLDEPPGDFAKLHAGDRVRFIARFSSSNHMIWEAGNPEPISVWLLVRFPDDQPKSPAAH